MKKMIVLLVFAHEIVCNLKQSDADMTNKIEK